MIVKDYVGIQQLKAFISKSSQIVLDIETTGLNQRKDEIIGIGLHNGTTGFYILHKQWNGSSLQTVVQASQIKPVLELLKSKKLITYNGAFDLPFITNYFGIDLLDSLYIEGMLIKHTVDEERPFALKEVAAKLFGNEAKAEQADLQADLALKGAESKQFYKADSTILAKYCLQDCKLTWDVVQHYLPILRAEGLEDFYFRDEVMPLYREVTIPMEGHGIKLDMPLLLSTQQEIAIDINQLEQQIRDAVQPHLGMFEKWFLDREFPVSRRGEFAQQVAQLFGVGDLLPKTKQGNLSFTDKAIQKLPDSGFKRFMLGQERLPDEVVWAVQQTLQGRAPAFNLQSKHHWKKVFFEQLGETPLSYTETGLPQLDDEFLETVKDKYDFVPWLLDYNRLNKIKSTYVDRFINEAEDGVFYPTFMQHSTISGRYSGDFQQLPRAKEESEASELVRKYNNRIRKFFIAREGKIFLDADYESLEPKIFAHISNEKSLQDLFAKGHDFYSTVAIEVFKPANASADKSAPNYLGKIDKPLRQTAKAIALSIPYGKQVFGLSKDLNISEREAKDVYNKYMAAFPSLLGWMQASKQQVLTKGFIRIESGRIRHFNDIPNLYKAYGDVLLDPLKVYERWGKIPEKYRSMKFLSSKLRNAVNNANNVQCQGLAASIVNRASIAINREFKRLKMDIKVVANTHDQLICECPVDLADKAAIIMQGIMENNYKISVPLTAPVNKAYNLHDSH